MSDLPIPINRHEQYLNAIATGNVDDLPTPPITREEVFLDYIARNGGGGGGGAVTGVKGSAESTYRTGNVDISAANIGLGDVDNTSDLNKPISTATQTALNGKVSTSSVGSANGVAELDANGRVPSSQLPSYVDDVLEYADLAHFPATGESGKIYIAEDTNKTYRWSGSDYAEISESLALGETSSTAYAGNKGKANADAISAIKDGTNLDSFADVETALAGKANSSDLGDKSNLTTTDKSSAVAAINEVNNFAKSMLAPSTLLSSSDDLNSILTAGVYRTEGTSVPAHAIGNNHMIWVIKQGSENYTRYLQVMYSFNTKEMYFRQTTDAGSTWSNWTLISSEDTGWMQIGTSGIYYRKIGSMVTLRGTTQSSTGWTTLCVLPSNLRPTSDIMRAIRALNDYATLYITQSGDVNVQSNVSANLGFQESYLLG